MRFYADRHIEVYNKIPQILQKGMTSGSWEEMVQGAVGDSDYLKEQLVDLLMQYNEVTEAARWAIVYGLDDSVLPETVLAAKEELKRYEIHRLIWQP